ncbi:MAG: hypothetical protein [Bacteriophage sp.]|nr:MAG: hypothetical protein [Bacteriophage sp.]
MVFLYYFYIDIILFIWYYISVVMSNELKNLNGLETKLYELDNKIMNLGFYSVYDEVDEETLLENGSATFTSKENNEYMINIEFDIIGKDNEGFAIIKVTAVDEL